MKVSGRLREISDPKLSTLNRIPLVGDGELQHQKADSFKECEFLGLGIGAGRLMFSFNV